MIFIERVSEKEGIWYLERKKDFILTMARIGEQLVIIELSPLPN